MIQSLSNWRAMNALQISTWLLVVAVASSPIYADIIEMAYSFSNNDKGGIGIVRVDRETGRILRPKVAFESTKCRLPVKVRRSADRNTLYVTNIEEDGPHLFLVQGDKSSAITLASVPDELRFANQQLVVTCEDDQLAVIEAETGKIERIIKLDRKLDPPANKPEDVHITNDMKYALVTFQKDSKTGRKKGSRVAIFKLPESTVSADILLPRKRPDLHIEGNRKQQGPAPEVVLVSAKSNTVFVTLDLYGAIGLFDWNAARLGRLEGWKMISAAPDGSWGKAFPDRATLFRRNESDYVMVCNAGTTGGALVVDLQARSVIWKRDTPAGLEAPVFFSNHDFAYSVCSGKTKQRADGDVDKRFHPNKSLYVFDLRATDPRVAPTEQLELGIYTTQIRAIPGTRPLLLITGGVDAEEPDTVMTVDPIEKKILDQYSTSQVLVRLER